ncbi:retrovirus-related pol polyprotein from transposon TNT 1-94 [Tanacetum coccineum]
MSSSSTVTYTSVYTDSETGRVFWGADEELSDGGSPRFIVYGYDRLPMQPVAPPSPDYVPGPEYPLSPDYVSHPKHPHSPVEPLPIDASPTALSLGYVTDSDPDEDPEDDLKEDHADYPADGGDNDDEPSDDDDDDTDDEDEEPFEDEDDNDKEEHLAQTDSSAIPIVDPIPSAGDKYAFETDEAAPTPVPSPRRHTGMMSVRPQTPIPFPSEAEVERLLALPIPPPSPLSPREDTPKAELPPYKRLCLTTPTSRNEVGESSTAAPRPTRDPTEAVEEVAPTTLKGVNARVTELVVVQEQDTQDIYAVIEDAQDRQTQLSQRVDVLIKDAVHYELQAYRTHTQTQDYCIASHESLTATLIAQNNMPPRRSSAVAARAAAAATPMTAAAVEQLIQARVSAALANHKTLQNSTNGHGDGSHNSKTRIRGTVVSRWPSQLHTENQVVQIVLWYLDSGCSKKYVRGDRSRQPRLLNFMKKFIGTVRFMNDHFGAIMGYGDYVIGDNTDGVELIKGSCGSNLYTISVEDMMKSSPICLLSIASKNKSWLWHLRLNHLNFGTINDLASKDLVRGLPRLKFEKDHLCSACQLGKSKKYTHTPKTENTNLEVLNTLHMDLCGLMRVQTINGKKCILVIVDDYSRFTWVKFLRSKDETPEFVIKSLKQIQLVHDKKPDLTFFRVFGTLCYPTNDIEDLGKLQAIANIRIFVGYAPSRKGYRIYNKRPAPTFLMPGQISSGLVPNLVPAAPYVPPTNKELEILFQSMFDEYLESPHVERLVSPAPAVPDPVNLAGTPSSTTIDKDEPSPSHSSSSSALQSLTSQQGVAVGSSIIKDNPFTPIDNDPFVNVFAPEPSSEASSSGDVSSA